MLHWSTPRARRLRRLRRLRHRDPPWRRVLPGETTPNPRRHRLPWRVTEQHQRIRPLLQSTVLGPSPSGGCLSAQELPEHSAQEVA